MDLYANCAKNPNNPDSRDGTRIFINDGGQEISELRDDINSASGWLAGGHKILIAGSIIGIALQTGLLNQRTAPSRFQATWKPADDALQQAEARLSTAVQNWMGGTMNQSEVAPYLTRLSSATANLKKVLNSIPCPR